MSMTIAGAKKFLQEQGYYTECLWRISDVMDNYECTEEQAQAILHNSVSSDYITQEIWEEIDHNATGLKRKDPEEEDKAFVKENIEAFKKVSEQLKNTK